jgi:protein transport protein SEC24
MPQRSHPCPCPRSRLDETRQALFTRLSAALREFRFMNANAALRQPNKLIFPETYKYMPIFTLGLVKCAALR